MFNFPYYDYEIFTPFFLPPNCDKPPTLYSVMNSIVNGMKEEEEYSPINELPYLSRSVIFNFDYPLSDKVTKEKFETNILKHFMMRRIGYETVTAFRIQLDSKLNEIMPKYNKMFDSLTDWNIFSDGEITTRTGQDSQTGHDTNATNNSLTNNSSSNNSTTSDRRFSDTPQEQLSDVRDGSYVTTYNYDTNTATSQDASTSQGQASSVSDSTNNKSYNETITKTPSDKMAIYEKMQNDITSIYTLIYKDLENLFYQIID